MAHNACQEVYYTMVGDTETGTEKQLKIKAGAKKRVGGLKNTTTKAENEMAWKQVIKDKK